MKERTKEFWRQVWREMIRKDQRHDDLEDRVPDDIGLVKAGEFWYVTATYGRGLDHEHVEIKLDAQRFADLYADVDAEMERIVSVVTGHDEPVSDPPTQPAPASPPPAPRG